MGASKKSHHVLLVFLATACVVHVLKHDLFTSRHHDTVECQASSSCLCASNYEIFHQGHAYWSFTQHLRVILPCCSSSADRWKPTLGLRMIQLQTFPAVHDDDPAIQSDDCSYWCHISCAGVTSRSYQRLVKKSMSFAWNCFQCGSTNVGSSSSLQGLDLSHSNSFLLYEMMTKILPLTFH